MKLKGRVVVELWRVTVVSQVISCRDVEAIKAVQVCVCVCVYPFKDVSLNYSNKYHKMIFHLV